MSQLRVSQSTTATSWPADSVSPAARRERSSCPRRVDRLRAAATSKLGHTPPVGGMRRTLPAAASRAPRCPGSGSRRTAPSSESSTVSRSRSTPTTASRAPACCRSPWPPTAPWRRRAAGTTAAGPSSRTRASPMKIGGGAAAAPRARTAAGRRPESRASQGSAAPGRSGLAGRGDPGCSEAVPLGVQRGVAAASNVCTGRARAWPAPGRGCPRGRRGRPRDRPRRPPSPGRRRRPGRGNRPGQQAAAGRSSRARWAGRPRRRSAPLQAATLSATDAHSRASRLACGSPSTSQRDPSGAPSTSVRSTVSDQVGRGT